MPFIYSIVYCPFTRWAGGIDLLIILVNASGIIT